MLAFSNDYYGMIFRATQSVELFCAYDVPVRVELASEFRYRKMPVNKNSLVIVISQSGETADTLAALRLAKEKGITTLAIVNVVGSSIAREADKVFYTLAGPEISVATTKAYSAQLVAMYCLAVQFARVRNTITEEQYGNYITELLKIPDKIQKILQDKERLQWFAAKYANAHDVFFVGRGIDYIVVQLSRHKFNLFIMNRYM